VGVISTPFILARITAYRSALGAVLLITFVVGAALAALAVYDGRALRQATYNRLADGDTAITVSLPAASQSQFAAQSAALRSAASSALGPVPYTMNGTLWSVLLTLPQDVGPSAAGQTGPTTESAQPVQPLLQLAAFGDLAAHATLSSGTWPTAPDAGSASTGAVAAALPVEVADELHLSVGSRLALHDRTDNTVVSLRVTGLFQPAVGGDPYWDQSPFGLAGEQLSPPFETFGPVVVDEGAFAGGVLAADHASWSLQPSVAAMAGQGQDATTRSLSTLTTLVQRSPVVHYADLSTTLPAQLAALRSAHGVTLSGLFAVALALLALALCALVVSAGPLAAQREAETFLFAHRGRARRQALLANLAEAAVLGAVGLLAAAPAGIALAGFLTTGASPAAAAVAGGAISPFSRPAWLAAAAVAALGAAVLVAATSRGQHRDPRRPSGLRAPRLAGPARAGADLLVLALAALGFWQLHSLPLVGTGTGSGTGAASGTGTGAAFRVNPLAAITPALALLAAALLSLRLLPLAGVLGDRLAARRRGVAGALTAWQVSRRPAQQSGPALLLVLAAATGAFGLCVHATWLRSATDQSANLAGAQVRLTLYGPPSAADATDAAIAQDHAVRAATTAVRTTAYDGAAVLAVESASAADTVLLRPDQYSQSPATLWAALRNGVVQLPALHGRPARLSLTLTLTGGEPSTGARALANATVSLTLEEGNHEFVDTTPEPFAADGRAHTVVFPLGRQTTYPLRIAGLGLSYQPPLSSVSSPDALSVSALAVSDQESGPSWTPAAPALAGWSSLAGSADLQQAARNANTGSAFPSAGQNATRGPLLGTSWAGWSQSFDPGYGGLPDYDSATGQLVGFGRASATLTFSGPAPQTIPALATAAFLDDTKLGVGDLTQITVNGHNLPVRIVGSVAQFPSIDPANSSGGLIVDETAVQSAVLAHGLPALPVTEWWLDTGGTSVPRGIPDTVTAAVRSTILAALLADPLARLTQQGLEALGLAAGILAVTAVWTAVVAARRERRGQEAVLAALGISSRRQVVIQCAERLAVAAPAAILGVGIGVLLARLLMPYLILTGDATTPSPPALFAVAWGPVTLLAAVVAAGPVLAAAAGAWRRTDPAVQLRLMEDL